MSYEVTATRRRPQRFDDLVGQEFVAETLKNSIKSGKIAHAYLFSGPRGCGKTSTARILAKALNCQEGPTDTPCGKCSNCLEITKGASLDTIEIDGASNNSIENIRQIKDEVLFPPNNSRYKIYIIDEVHMLSNAAFNALLKTIEEPPEYVIFIFATTELQKVPATIKSRCQQYNFRLVAIDKVKQCLSEAAAELNIQADEEALYWIARESTGSMRDAYTLFDQVVAFSDSHITYEKIRDKLGLLGIDRMNMIFESCAYGRTDEVISSLDEFLQGGISIEQLISNCSDYLRSLMLIKNGIKKESLLGNSPERYSKVVLGAWNPIQIERALSIFLQLYRDIRYSISPRYELELAFSRLCWISQYVSNAEVKKAIDAAQALLCGNSAQTSAPAVSAPVTPAANTTAQAVQTNQEQQRIPNGLPRFSMLDNPPEEEGNQEEAQNPFHDGGPLPPEQSVAETVEPEEPKKLDERLILHVGSETVDSSAASKPVYVVPVSEQGYSVNPDDEDDGWTNVDEPPEEPYYPENYENYDDFEDSDGEKAGTSNGNAGQNDAKLKLIEALSVIDVFAANAVEKTDGWMVKASEVETTIASEYEKGILDKRIQTISEELSKIYGKPMTFVVNLSQVVPEKKQQTQASTELPEQIKILMNTFKGSIIAGK